MAGIVLGVSTSHTGHGRGRKILSGGGCLFMGTVIPAQPWMSHPEAEKGGNWQLAINKLTINKATC